MGTPATPLSQISRVMERPVPSQYARFTRIAEVGVLLAGERHLPRLYDLIVREALALCNAQAGAVYIRQDELLEPAAMRAQLPGDGNPFRDFGKSPVPLGPQSLCGQAALNDRIFNIPDMHAFPEEHPALLYPEFAELSREQARTLLAVPMKTPQSGTMGILLLLNAMSSDGSVVPFDPLLEDLMSAVAEQGALAIQSVRWAIQLHQAYQDTLYRLSLAAEYREDPSGSHVRRVGLYSGLIAKAYGLPEERAETIRIASTMHDIGKITIPETILLKPGPLTPEEFEQMKKHTTLGALILGGSKTEVLRVAERIALTHHEKFDGTGYPFGQAGVEIPLEGRIVGLIDVLDALTTPRPYKKPIAFPDAVRIVQQESGKHFDPDCVLAFLKVQDEIRRILETTVKPSAPAN